MRTELPLDTVIESLDQAVTETLETMFFVDSRPETAAEPTTDVVKACVRFEGDQDGWLEIAVADDAARELAANFLGADSSEMQDGQVDAVCCEMANMVCGAMVSIMAPDGHFVLSHPEPVAADDTFAGQGVCRTYQMERDILAVKFNCVAAQAGTR